jgi:hypothetical protein
MLQTEILRRWGTFLRDEMRTKDSNQTVSDRQRWRANHLTDHVIP